jgi:type IV pilus assembly protein PilW
MKRLRQQGMTIIEVMISMLLGSLLVIAVMLVLGGMGPRQSAEGSRRTLGASADLDQSGAIAMYQLEKWIRSAGTGLAQTVKSPYTYSYAYGCKLFAAKGGSQILPFTGTFPKPFDDSTKFLPSSAAGVFRLMPALIVPDATVPGMANAVTTHTSDALVLMSSGNGYGAVPLPLTAAATNSQLVVPNTTAFSGANVNDLALVADSQIDTSTNNLANCMVTQAALVSPTDGSATTLPLGGSWWQISTIGTQAMSSYSSSAYVLDLGDPSATSTQPPQFLAVGVGDNDTLFVYDLLGVRTPQLQGRGQNVFEMHALYGVDTDSDGKVDSWVSASSGNYTVAKLTAGNVTASNLIKTIKALRVALILRSDLPEKDPINTSTTLTLFPDLAASLQVTRTLTGAELNYRYRVVEATIPIRNNSF